MTEVWLTNEESKPEKSDLRYIISKQKASLFYFLISNLFTIKKLLNLFENKSGNNY